MVFGPRFVGEAISHILDMRFQIEVTSEHVPILVEFRSASLEIGQRKEEERRKKKKESVVKYKSADMYVGQPNNF